MHLVEPWEVVTDEQYQRRIEAELAKELAGREADVLIAARLLARRIDRDDFLFKTSNAQWPYAVVHLTFSGRAERAPWPVTHCYAGDDTLATRLAEDVAGY